MTTQLNLYYLYGAERFIHYLSSTWWLCSVTTHQWKWNYCDNIVCL